VGVVPGVVTVVSLIIASYGGSFTSW
jgi:hypothetical protein